MTWHGTRGRPKPPCSFAGTVHLETRKSSSSAPIPTTPKPTDSRAGDPLSPGSTDTQIGRFGAACTPTRTTASHTDQADIACLVPFVPLRFVTLALTIHTARLFAEYVGIGP